MAYVLKVEDLRKAVRCLEEALKIYPGKTVANAKVASGASA
jgi:aspartate aminotransferase